MAFFNKLTFAQNMKTSIAPSAPSSLTQVYFFFLHCIFSTFKTQTWMYGRIKMPCRTSMFAWECVLSCDSSKCAKLVTHLAAGALDLFCSRVLAKKPIKPSLCFLRSKSIFFLFSCYNILPTQKGHYFKELCRLQKYFIYMNRVK